MAIATGTAILGAAAIGGGVALSASKRAADAQGGAVSEGIAEQRAARAQAERLGEPFVDLGTSAANELSGFLGLDSSRLKGFESDLQSAQFALEDLQSKQVVFQEKGGSKFRKKARRLNEPIRLAQVAFDRAQSAFNTEQTAFNEQQLAFDEQQSGATQEGIEEINPVLSFLRDQGFEQIQESAAAGGRLGAGGTLKDLTQFNTDLASTIVPQLQNQRFNQLFNVAGLGANTAAQQGTQALNTASNIGNLLNTGARAEAEGIFGQANAITNTLGNVSEALGAFGRPTAPPTGGPINVQDAFDRAPVSLAPSF